MSKKKFFTLLLALVTALTMSLAGTALAADTWDGTTRGPVPAPVNNVITITTGAQLAGVADAVNSAYSPAPSVAFSAHQCAAAAKL